MGMSRPLTWAQTLQNRAFLKLLRKTGNVRLACRELGLKYATMQDRRRKHPAFAVKWDAALVFAAARFEAVGVRGPAAGRPRCSPLRPLAYQTDKKGRHGSESRDVGRVRSAEASRPAGRPGSAVSRRNDAPPDRARGPLTLRSAARHRTVGGE